MYHVSRGDEFRVAFALLGELRSIIPTGVNILALTATATKSTLTAVTRRLSMINPVIVGAPPHRNNIKLSVIPLPDIKSFCASISEEVKIKVMDYPKTVIFCNNYNVCAELFHRLRSALGPYSTIPSHYPDLHEFRVIELYTRASTVAMKEKVLQSVGSKLRIVIATTAFGLGIDCPDITRIIHWGPPSTLEQYVQESGRAGRNGSMSDEAIMLYGHPSRFVDDDVKEYGLNKDKCRRKLLYTNFLFVSADTLCNEVGKCDCCDVCSNVCKCSKCCQE